jgi:hypothetical protein
LASGELLLSLYFCKIIKLGSWIPFSILQ